MSNTEWEKKSPANAKRFAEQEFLGSVGNILCCTTLCSSTVVLAHGYLLPNKSVQLHGDSHSNVLDTLQHCPGDEVFQRFPTTSKPSQHKLV